MNVFAVCDLCLRLDSCENIPRRLILRGPVPGLEFGTRRYACFHDTLETFHHSMVLIYSG